MTQRPSGLLLDLDGTVYADDALIPGADRAIASLRAGDIPVRFVTNTTRVSRATIARWLEDFGIAAEPDDIFTPPVAAAAAAARLREREIRRVAICPPEDSHEEFAELDIVAEEPQAVVIGDLGPGWTFQMAVALLAAFVPARRAATTDPARTLQEE